MSTSRAYPKVNPQKIVYARQLTVENGLSSNYVNALLRDSKNFTWVGTINGLNKYDGHHFRHYFHKPFDSVGIQSNNITALAEDKTGAIWCGTTGAGLERLDRKTDKFTHFRFDPLDPQSIGSDNVECLCVDSKGRIWIGLANGELDYFEPHSQKFWRYYNVRELTFSLEINPIVSIINDSKALWIRKNRGMILFDPASALCRPVAVDNASANFYIEPKRDAGLFIANPNLYSVYYFKSLSFPLKSINAQKIHSDFAMEFTWKSIIFRNDSILWNFSTFGLQEINLFASLISNIEIRSQTNSIIKLRSPRHPISDNEGNIWVPTENGIVIIEPNFSPIYVYPLPIEKKLPYSSARSICMDNQERLLVGTSSGILYFLDSLSNAWRKFPISNFNRNMAFNRMNIDDENSLWIGSSNNPLLKINLRNHNATFFRKKDRIGTLPNIHSLLIDKHSLWFGEEESGGIARGGVLNYMTLSPFSLRQFEYMPNDSSLTLRRIITTIVKRDEASLWIGSVHGLFIFDTKAGQFTRFCHNPHDPSSLSGDHVWVIHKDRKGQVWVGTWGDGLNLFDENSKRFRHYSIEEGLPSNIIFGILEDLSGDLWISTANGISHYDQHTKTFTNFTTADGLLDTEYEPNSAAISSNGRMYFGGAKGITSFFPSALKRKVISAPLMVTEFQVFNIARNSEITDHGEITIPYTDNDFSFEFAKLDYLDPLEKSYEYMLEGVDPNWINSGSRNIASYNNIDPGTYTFRFRTKSDTTVSFASLLVISPAFWMTIWFKSGIFIFAILLIGYLYRGRITKLKEFQIQLQLASENERTGLAGELHDGPLQDLYGTRFMLDSLMRRGETDTDAAKLDIVLKKVRGDLRTLTGDLQLPHFELGFAEEIRLFCEAFSERNSGISITLDVHNETNPLPPKYAQNLFRIFRTAMANVTKHSFASKIEVTFVTTKEAATLKIIDNGTGFIVPQSLRAFNGNKHYGLFLMQNYAASINAKCVVHSVPGKGTTVEIIVPLKAPLWRKRIKRQFANFAVFLYK